MKENVSHPSVVFGREVLGEIFGKVFSSLLSVQAELVIFDAAVHPVEAHFKSFGTLLAHVAGEDAVVGRTVGLGWCGWLRLENFDEVRVDGNSLLAVEVECSSFGLGGGIHDGVDGLTFGEDRSIWSRSTPDVGRWWIVAQVVVARSATAHFGLNGIRCVTVDMEAHDASVEPDDGV